MTDKKKDNPGHITTALCDAYRDTLKIEITDLKNDVKSIESRTWQILAGIGISILLTLLSIAMK
ncbi:hypothetical protein LCGC14_3139900 [marine sediment metagenome]|uniref:Uncharacterized protein n=1 Tax=marine sediment metagenome TaxID=412755 RepID=A0A0F8WL70_9ZZZZ